jgi:anti-anti-sigma regulatory factor
MTVANWTFDVEMLGDVTVLRFAVDEICTDNLDEITDELLDFITPEAPRTLVVDLSRVRYVDRTGLETLGIFHDSLCNDGSVVRWRGLQPTVREAVRHSFLHQQFGLTESFSTSR